MFFVFWWIDFSYSQVQSYVEICKNIERGYKYYILIVNLGLNKNIRDWSL